MSQLAAAHAAYAQHAQRCSMLLHTFRWCGLLNLIALTRTHTHVHILARAHTHTHILTHTLTYTLRMRNEK